MFSGWSYSNVSFCSEMFVSHFCEDWKLTEVDVVGVKTRLRNTINLLSSDHYGYLQIRNYTTKHLDWDQIRWEPTKIEKHLINIVENNDATEKQVSLMYQKLLMDVLDNTQHRKQQ